MHLQWKTLSQASKITMFNFFFLQLKGNFILFVLPYYVFLSKTGYSIEKNIDWTCLNFCGKRPYATKFSLVWNILLSCCLRPFYIFCHILVIIICIKDHISRLMYQIKNIVFIYCISLCHVYLQVHIQKFEYYEKGQYFLSLISESETHIL